MVKGNVFSIEPIERIKKIHLSGEWLIFVRKYILGFFRNDKICKNYFSNIAGVVDFDLISETYSKNEDTSNKERLVEECINEIEHLDFIERESLYMLAKTTTPTLAMKEFKNLYGTCVRNSTWQLSTKSAREKVQQRLYARGIIERKIDYIRLDVTKRKIRRSITPTKVCDHIRNCISLYSNPYHRRLSFPDKFVYLLLKEKDELSVHEAMKLISLREGEALNGDSRVLRDLIRVLIYGGIIYHSRKEGKTSFFRLSKHVAKHVIQDDQSVNIGGLPDTMFRIFYLRYENNYDFIEIAERFAIDITMAESLYQKAHNIIFNVINAKKDFDAGKEIKKQAQDN